ncbi:MAG TPA: hypothetical protein VMN99_00675 [Anaerolineales bacterium]|nr:hypothetical protein [Anaerolineales bacterium]
MREASKYASAAVADPDIRPIYVQMAVDHNKNPKRPFDMAVSDYDHHGNDLLWKKHLGDQEKPKNWNMLHYSWYFTKPKRNAKRRTSAIKELLTFSYEQSCYFPLHYDARFARRANLYPQS